MFILKSIVFFLISLTVSINDVVGKCRTTGGDWGGAANRALATNFVKSVCDELRGSYGDMETRTTCRNGNDKIKFDYLLQHITGGSRSIDEAECMDGMKKEITGCDNGGDTRYTNWRYSVDPNPGACWGRKFKSFLDTPSFAESKSSKKKKYSNKRNTKELGSAVRCIGILKAFFFLSNT